MTTARTTKTILAAAALAILATTALPADGFAAAAGRGPNGRGGSSAGASAGSAGPSGSAANGHGGGNSLAVAGTSTNGDALQWEVVVAPPVVGRHPARRAIRIRFVRHTSCAGRILVDGDPDPIAFRVCQQAAY